MKDYGYLVSWDIQTDDGPAARTTVCTNKASLVKYISESITGDGGVCLINQFEGVDFDTLTIIPLSIVDETFSIEGLDDVPTDN